MESILITGGAGFLGSTVALGLRNEFPKARIIAFDNLRRRGSELNLPRLKSRRIEFVHGDVRSEADLNVGPVDLLVECSAEPSVLAGREGDARYLIDTNLGGAVNCLELARRQKAALVFVSSSRVYPFDRIREIPLIASGQRLILQPGAQLPPGISRSGLTPRFPLFGRRTLYGATKLSAELLVQEYADVYDVPAVILRLGVIAGPWQMGKIDQGFAALWVAKHMLGRDLAYIGFGGQGFQVRDLLHADDAFTLILKTLTGLPKFRGNVYNAGGGQEGSVSLFEMTELCQKITERSIHLAPVLDDRPGDIPWYITDNSEVTADLGWRPQKSPEDIVKDLVDWFRDNPAVLDMIGG